VTKPPPKLPSTAEIIRSVIPDSLWRRLGNRPPLDATIFGDCTALAVSVGPGAPLRLLLVYADWDGKLCPELWELQRKGVKTLARDRVNSNRLAELLSAWEQSYLR